ncbi:hypothetical protein EJD97_022089, partial [Solanum chilense]
MVHDQQVEKARVKRKSSDAKRARFYDGCSSKGRLDIQYKPRINKTFSNKVPTKFPKGRDNRVSKPKSKKERGTSSPSKKLICGKCCKKNYGDCLVGKDKCFGCCKSGQKVRDFPNLKGQDKVRGKTQASGSNVHHLKKNCSYALHSKGEQESSPDVVTARNFDILPDIPNVPFMITISVVEPVVAKK